MTVIGQGTFLVDEPNQPSAPRLARFVIQETGIDLYDPPASPQPQRLFDFLQTLTSGQTLNSGQLGLVSLPASPQAAFYNVNLTPDSLPPNTSEVTLTLTQTERFAPRGDTFFKDLNITFTESQSGSSLTVGGSVTLCLFGRSDIGITLVPHLTSEGLFFQPADSQSFDIESLGRLTIKALKAGRNAPIWDDLQARYSFTELTGNSFGDSSGSALSAIDLTSNEPITRVPGGISIGDSTVSARHQTVITSSQEAANRIVTACKTSNAITISAWIRPTRKFTREDDRLLPARIISLSENETKRNFTLAQEIHRNENENRYIVRLRREKGNDQGTPPLFSNPVPLPTDDLAYVAFTREATPGPQSAKIYINGKDQTDREISADLSGDFRGERAGNSNKFRGGWSDDYPLLLGNEKTKNRPWDGEIHQVEIYSRALPEEEIFNNYVPALDRLTATLQLKNVPSPLNAELPVTIDWDANQLIVNQQDLSVAPFLKFNQVKFTWGKTASDIELLSGNVAALLWDNPLAFDVSITADQLLLSHSNADGTELTLNEPEVSSTLGKVRFNQLALSVDRTIDDPAWQFQTEGQGITFDHISPPLKGPFPLELFLDDGKLWFSISPETPLPLVEDLAFSHAALRFVRESNDSGWQVQSDMREDRNGISLPLFGASRPLTAQLVESGSAKALALEWTAAPVDQAFGKLNPSLFSLRGNNVDPDNLFWHLEIIGKIPLGAPQSESQSQILDFAGLDFSTANGKLLGDPENAQQSLTFQGEVLLKHITTPIFNDTLQLQGDRFLSTGTLNLFSVGSLVQLVAEPQFEFALDGQVTFSSIPPTQVVLPDAVLVNPTLALNDGRIALRGLWLGQPEPIIFYVRERAEDIFLHGIAQIVAPFSLNLPALVDSKTGAQLAKAVEISATPMTMNLDSEFQTAGYTGVLNANFSYQDADNIIQTITLPERRLYSPPASTAALLGDVVAQLKATAVDLFKIQGRHQADYGVTLGPSQPQIFLTQAEAIGGSILSIMPAIFKADVDIASDNGTFSLRQTGDICELTLDIAQKTSSEIRTEYDDFLAQKVAVNETFSTGAIPLLKRRIAERLRLDYDQVLYYYYGWDVEKGYIDLHAGMRLRVDLQNYQFVQASDPSAERGFVGSGSFYIPVNTYTTGQSEQLIGFGPFLSRLQVNGSIDIAQQGAGSVFDLLKEGYRLPYYRLFFPKQPSVGAGSERFVTLIGAKTLQEMIEATNVFESSGSLAPTLGASFFFRGRAIILPEIQIYVGNQPIYVPVGTTLRQLAERYDDIPVAGLPGQDLRAFFGATRPLRLVHDGVNSEPSYRFINLETPGAVGNQDGLDLPLVKGDRICF